MASGFECYRDSDSYREACSVSDAEDGDTLFIWSIGASAKRRISIRRLTDSLFKNLVKRLSSNDSLGDNDEFFISDSGEQKKIKAVSVKRTLRDSILSDLPAEGSPTGGNEVLLITGSGARKITLSALTTQYIQGNITRSANSAVVSLTNSDNAVNLSSYSGRYFVLLKMSAAKASLTVTLPSSGVQDGSTLTLLANHNIRAIAFSPVIKGDISSLSANRSVNLRYLVGGNDTGWYKA